MNTGYTFRAWWPILNAARPLAMLKVEACAEIDAMAAAEGARIVGEITWETFAGYLIADAPAALAANRGRVEYGSVTRLESVIRDMATRGLVDRQIADLLGCSEAAVTKVRSRARPPIPAGTSDRQQMGRVLPFRRARAA